MGTDLSTNFVQVPGDCPSARASTLVMGGELLFEGQA